MKTMKYFACLVPLFLGLTMVLFVGGGCASEPPPFVQPADRLTYEERIDLVNKAVAALKIDPRFTEEYANKKQAIAAKRKRPVIACAYLKNNIPGETDNCMREMTLEFQNQLRKSGLFDVIDDFLTLKMLDRLVRPDLGENNDGLQNIGTYQAPDFFVDGELRRERDGADYVFCFHVSMLDTATRKVFWSDILRFSTRQR